MAKKGYALVCKDQAEQARAGYATSPIGKRVILAQYCGI
jgi:hypothetical protein